METIQTTADHKSWSYKEFICFTLIYASYEDLDFSEDEEKFIKQKTSVETFDKMHQIFQDAGQYECLQMILDQKSRFFATEVQKEDLLNILSQFFGADGEFSKLEKVLMGFLRNML